MEGTEACFAPVLEPDEAAAHPHNASRHLFVDMGGVVQPAPPPRFSRTPPVIAGPPPRPGQHTDEALVDWGLTEAEVFDLRATGAVARACGRRAFRLGGVARGSSTPWAATAKEGADGQGS